MLRSTAMCMFTPIASDASPRARYPECASPQWYNHPEHLLDEAVGFTVNGGRFANGCVYMPAEWRIPAEGEVVMFAQVGTLTERLISLLTAAGQAPDPKQIADWKKIQAIAWGTKFEDAMMRDTLFILSPGSAVEQPLAQNALALSDPNTVLTYSTTMPASFDVADSSLGLVRSGWVTPGMRPPRSAP